MEHVGLKIKQLLEADDDIRSLERQVASSPDDIHLRQKLRSVRARTQSDWIHRDDHWIHDLFQEIVEAIHGQSGSVPWIGFGGNPDTNKKGRYEGKYVYLNYQPTHEMGHGVVEEALNVTMVFAKKDMQPEDSLDDFQRYLDTQMRSSNAANGVMFHLEKTNKGNGWEYRGRVRSFWTSKAFPEIEMNSHSLHRFHQGRQVLEMMHKRGKIAFGSSVKGEQS